MQRYLNSLSLRTRIVGAMILILAAVIGGLALYFSPAVSSQSEGFTLRVVLTGIASAAAVIFLMILLLDRVLMPLDALSAAMRRAAQDADRQYPLPAGEDEIGYLVRHFDRLVAERRASEERLEYLSSHDALTGLPNRSLMQSRFSHILASAERRGSRVGLLYLDLDNFKTINDSLGHVAGDEVIRQVGLRLRECIDEEGIVGRLDGDEFVIVLRDVADSAEIERMLIGIVENLAMPVFCDGQEIAVSVSIGVAVGPEDGSDFVSLCKKADTAMVQAKESGRNTYRFFDMEMNVDAMERLLLRSHMKRALERNEFVLHYQPQIDLHSGMVVGAEALIRWQHPELGLLQPGMFISIAEDSGLIVSIGKWVLREACRQAAEWRRQGLPELVVAVNLSAAQFRRGDLEQTVIDAMENAGLPPEYLELELTESILVKDTENVLQQVRRLKSLGLKLSIDDFGTGYSSLAYLKKFAVDKIKIDRSFVSEVASNPDDAAIVRAIIQIAQSLSLKTIAEGAEDERTIEHLRLHRCNEVQGYYFSKPLPVEKFAMFLCVAANAGHAGAPAA